MGTNYYFMCRDKELVQNSFAIKESWGVHSEEYEIVDEPYLGYEIHLNKLSCGWRPLFQRHRAFNTFNQLKDFFLLIKIRLRYLMNMVISICGMNILIGFIRIV